MRTLAQAALIIAASLSRHGVAQELGIPAKKPVFGGTCKVCPWGAMGDIVKTAMQSYRYEFATTARARVGEPEVLGPALESSTEVPDQSPLSCAAAAL
jgi:uncharacterized protein